MKDKMTTTGSSNNQPPKEFIDYLHTLVEDIAIKGESFDKYKKWLKKYCEEFSEDFINLEIEIIDFVELIDEYKNNQNNIIKKMLYKTADKLYFSNIQIQKILENSIKKINENSDKTISQKTIIKEGYIQYFGKKYKTEKFGNKLWMIENVRLFISNNDSFSISKSKSAGYVYRYDVLKKLEKDGFRIPTMKDWVDLAKIISNSSNIDFSCLKESEFNIEYLGYYEDGKILGEKESVSYWVNPDNEIDCGSVIIHSKSFSRFYVTEEYCNYVRLVKDV